MVDLEVFLTKELLDSVLVSVEMICGLESWPIISLKLITPHTLKMTGLFPLALSAGQYRDAAPTRPIPAEALDLCR